MISMDTVQLFSKGEYMVIFVDMMTYSPRYFTIHIKYTQKKKKFNLVYLLDFIPCVIVSLIVRLPNIKL